MDLIVYGPCFKRYNRLFKVAGYVTELQQYLPDEEVKRSSFYEHFCDNEKAEFINGEVVYHSPAGHKHTLVINNLSYVFTKFVRKNKSGIITGEKLLVKLLRNDFEPHSCFLEKK